MMRWKRGRFPDALQRETLLRKAGMPAASLETPVPRLCGAPRGENAAQCTASG